MTDFRFAEPQSVHAVWFVLAALAALVVLERRGGRALSRFVDPGLHERLVTRPSRLRRGLRIAFIGLSALALVVALMRPQWGGESIRSERIGAEIMICLDVSKSMLAEDVAPNRLERAKAEIGDLLTYLDGNQVGLIAFAGRASVLAPMTPDFGFLRLVLDSVRPGIVPRGGTRLEEPIRKAVAGFGEAGDLSRIILLITDGEDHDSFPLDAAKLAAERGIRILAVGFGDEAGSEIRITDPRSGARTLLRDSDGRVVKSRLDGETLRELALATEGAYIPAGTGVLDLASIFDAHIAPLMRSSGDVEIRTVRNEGYQWAILAALLTLLAAAATYIGGVGAATRVLLPLLLAGLLAHPDATAAEPPTGVEADEPSEAAVALEGEAGGRESLDIPEDAREAYNGGLGHLRDDALDEAERFFEGARSRAGIDGEARFRATYNLGWIDVARADAALESDPASALRSLERAADWFRAAISLRPKNAESRRNLEIVLGRILALSDSLAKEEPRNLAARLDALIDDQRNALAPMRELVDRVARSEDLHAVDALRREFRAAEVSERQLLSAAQELARLAGEEIDALEGTPEEERSPEDAMRAAQLQGLLHYLHRGRERIGQARSQLRQRQAERAYRRGASGLAGLKRARDQLLDPVQVLDAVLADAVRTAGETRALAALERGGAFAAGDAAPEVPAWLTSRYLGEAQDELAQRTEELHARVRMGLENAARAEGIPPEQQLLLQQLQEAEPLLGAGASELRAAHQALDREQVPAALEPQAAGIQALMKARERFFDLKRLIEAAYADQRQIRTILTAEPQGTEGEPGLPDPREYAGALANHQRDNLERVQRIGPLLERELRGVDEPKAEDEGADPDAIAARRQQQRETLEMAAEIVTFAESAMKGALESLQELRDDAAALAPAGESARLAERALESLRRIFFTIIEHLEDVARQQHELTDATADAGASLAGTPEESEARFGPVASRQTRLAEVTDELALALHEQSFEDPSEQVTPHAAQNLDEETAREVSERFVRASELVLSAHAEMTSAAEGLSAEARDLPTVGEHQDTALRNLVEAIQILKPPPPKQPPSDSEEQRQQEQEQESQSGEGSEQEQAQEQPSPQSNDPTQLLQQVRDREARRHRERGAGTLRDEPVEKDW